MGHIIFLDHSTGDGIVASLKILEVMLSKKTKLSDLNKILAPYPQKQVNLKVAEKKPLDEISGYDSLYKTLCEKNKNGRILVRYSGTESLLRILVEGKNEQVINDVARDLESFLKKELS